MNVLFLLKLGVILSKRAFSTHAKIKYEVLDLLSRAPSYNYDEFVDSINSKKRAISIDNDYDIKILATAAPTCYAEIIAKNENFDICLGTDFPCQAYDTQFENSKYTKRNRVFDYLESKGLTKVDTFITDHIDDLSIIKEATRNIIVSPSKEFIEVLKQNSISFEVIA